MARLPMQIEPAPPLPGLESADSARPLLQPWALRDCRARPWRNLRCLAEAITPDRSRDLLPAALGRLLPRCPDPDMAAPEQSPSVSSPTPAGAAKLPTLLEGRAPRSRNVAASWSARASYSATCSCTDPDSLGRSPRPAAADAARAGTSCASNYGADDRRSATRYSAVLRTAFRRFRQRQVLPDRAPTTASFAIGRWKKSPATCRGSPTSPLRRRLRDRPCGPRETPLRRTVYRGRPSGPLQRAGVRKARRGGVELQ